MSRLDDKKMVNDIRLLSLDMINNAGSGHPGICLGAANIMYALFKEHLVYDFDNPAWCNRDRFVLSAGHGSALLYATLYCTTNDYTIDDLKQYRVLNSITPGHPELNINKRIEATTGALGEGVATSVGLAMAEKHLEAVFNKKKEILFDYNIYCLCSDGDLMEGISYEAASLAGQYNLSNLILLYDANNVTLDGKLDKDYNEKIADMYTALGFLVLIVKNGESIKEINKAIYAAKKSNKPSLIIVNTTIGKYSLYEGENTIHGKLDKDDLTSIREKLDFTNEFTPDEENIEALKQHIKVRNDNVYSAWYQDYENYVRNATDEEVENLNDYLENEPIMLQLDKVIDQDKILLDSGMRDINFQIMNVISTFIPTFVGGGADTIASTKTYLKGKGNYSKDNYAGRNINFGVRENAMGAILNGFALTGFHPFGSTFLTFSDFMKPSIRNSALMNLPITYIFTHDSFTIGSDGATHQPVEQLGMLRTIPNLQVFRPCDYKELIGAWNLILKSNNPSALIVAKNPTETFKFTSIEEVSFGGYVISEVKNRLDLIIVASGSEVTLAMQLKQELLKSFIEARIVSMPNIDLFFKQDLAYRNQVLPKNYKKVVIEFSNDPNWYRIASDEEDIIRINHFGKSGSPKDLLEEFELDIPNIVIKIKNRL